MPRHPQFISLLSVLFFCLQATASETFLVKSSLSSVHHLADAIPQQAKIIRSFPEIGWIVVQAENEEAATATKISLQQNKAVAMTEDNMIWNQIAVPNDKNYSNQKEELRRMEVEAAWDLTTGSPSVIIAIVDSGISANHPDLKNRLWKNTAEIVNGVDDDKNGFIDDTYGWDFVKNDNIPEDGSNHGTHVAGIIGAEGNNREGITGVNWNTRIMVLRTLDNNGSGNTDTAVDAILYAVAKGARVINASWGGYGKSQALQDAIQYATDHGVLLVAAAGNNHLDAESEPFFPASYPVAGIVSVGSSEGKGRLSSFSNFGRFDVDVVAPGSAIYSTYGENSYERLSGTSMASPMVAGVAGLMLARDPSLSLVQLRNGLLNATVLQSGYRGYISTEGDISARLAVQQLNNSFQVWPAHATIALQQELALAIYPSGHDVRWSVSDSKLAEVDASGVIIGRGHGQVTVTATNGRSTQSVKINVIDPKASGGCNKNSARGSSVIAAEKPEALGLIFLFPILLIFILRRRRD
ncbi:MAG: S8 family serine peptidase [Bdellovibrionales bacterium]|nr:S8 family serine peptidase [Bdellovibrionales bacterium]